MLRLKRMGRLQAMGLIVLLMGIMGWFGGRNLLAQRQQAPEIDRRMQNQEQREAARAAQAAIALERRLTTLEVQTEALTKIKDYLTSAAFSALGLLIIFLGKNIWNASFGKAGRAQRE